MLKSSIRALLLTAGCLAFAGTGAAHHGDAGRYDDRVVTLTGTVVALQMVNPHSIIVFDVTGEDGNTVRWQAELGGPQGLARNFGWTRDTLPPGTQITLIGRRLRSGAPYLNLTERANIVLTATGEEIFRTGNFGEPDPQEVLR